jgi:terminase small subunit-like protein
MRKIPTHLRLLRGNPGKRPIRPEPEPPIPEKLLEPPAFLSEDAKNEWWRVVPELHALGLLTLLDITPLAAYCDAYGRWITAERLLAVMADKDAITKGLLLKAVPARRWRTRSSRSRATLPPIWCATQGSSA